MEKTKVWEPLIFRPELPDGWECVEQRWSCRYGEVTFKREGKIHHNANDTSLWIVFNEFNPYHWANENRGYTYSVRGGNHVQPNPNKLKYFHRLKDAENYVIYLAESTDRWVKQITSKDYIDQYNLKLETLKKITRRRNEF
jgi:hypothetical protein